MKSRAIRQCLVLVLATMTAIGQVSTAETGEPGGVTREECAAWIKAKGLEPADYVVSKFADHDLVIVGEVHEIADNCCFVASLIGPLHRAGVRLLATEFVRSALNGRLETILGAPEYDAAGVADLFRQGPWPTWGYQEYLDIVKAAWEWNRSLPKDADPFRVLGIDADWKQLDLLESASPRDRMELALQREEHMTGVVEREVFGKKRRALLHVGFAHSVRHGERLANVLARTHGDRMFQVVLHHAITGEDGRLADFIERAVADAGRSAAGFDVAGGPLAALREPGVMPFTMLGPKSSLRDLAEGYAVLKPLKDLRRVAWVPGFITAATFADARAVAEGLRWISKGSAATPEALDAAMAARLRVRD